MVKVLFQMQGCTGTDTSAELCGHQDITAEETLSSDISVASSLLTSAWSVKKDHFHLGGSVLPLFVAVWQWCHSFLTRSWRRCTLSIYKNMLRPDITQGFAGRHTWTHSSAACGAELKLQMKGVIMRRCGMTVWSEIKRLTLKWTQLRKWWTWARSS